MSDAWDGRPQNPEQSGMHLLRSRLTGHLTGWYWNAATERFHHEHITLGRTALLERYVYEGPILTPAEVAALVKAQVEDALLHTLHPEFGSIYDVDGEVTKAVEPLQAEIERLRRCWMRVLQEENSCEPTGNPCKSKRCGCLAELEALVKETGHEADQ